MMRELSQAHLREAISKTKSQDRTTSFQKSSKWLISISNPWWEEDSCLTRNEENRAFLLRDDQARKYFEDGLHDVMSFYERRCCPPQKDEITTIRWGLLSA